MSVPAEANARPAPLIAIDGPTGVGKSTIAGRLAEELGWRALDTGATYRAVALAALRAGVDLDNGPALAGLAQGLDLRFAQGEDGLRVELAGRDVALALRDEEVSRAVPRVARRPRVRRALIALQRRLAAQGPTVAEGRDMGTVVFPDAPLKVFLTASASERVERRRRQLAEQGLSADAAELERSVRERDRLDRHRPVGALRVADDALIVDATRFSQDEELRILLAAARMVFAGDSASEGCFHR
jgi:cytidylate kinase